MFTDLELQAACSSGPDSFAGLVHPQAIQQLGQVLQTLWADAYLVGQHAAQTQLRGYATRLVKANTATSGWDTWQPGNPSAAALAGNGGWSQTMADQGIGLRGITDTTMTRLGDTLSRGLADGRSIESMTRDLSGILSDPKRAELIAHTESARMLTLASLDSYRELGVRKWNWITSGGACPLCVERAAENPHEMSDAPPPGHPLCRCAVAPDMASLQQAMDAMVADAAAGDSALMSFLSGSAAQEVEAEVLAFDQAALGAIRDITPDIIDLGSMTAQEQVAVRNATDWLVPDFKAWAKDLFNTVFRSMTKEEKEALRQYKGASMAWKALNDKMRGLAWKSRKYDEAGLQNMERQLRGLMARTSLRESIAVYRGVVGLDLKVGDTFVEKAFTSTSISRNVPELSGFGHGQGSQFLRIIVPKGARGIPISNIGGRVHELEYLIDAGTKFKVVGRTGKWLDVVIVSQGGV